MPTGKRTMALAMVGSLPRARAAPLMISPALTLRLHRSLFAHSMVLVVQHGTGQHGLMTLGSRFLSGVIGVRLARLARAAPVRAASSRSLCKIHLLTTQIDIE